MEGIATIESAIEDIRKGRMVILVDDEDRENEGDVVVAAAKVTPHAINFMATHARGLICATLPDERVDAIGIPDMVSENRAPLGTAFTLSVDAADGTGSGISARDRCHTIQTLMRPTCTMGDLRAPGHVFPLRAREGGVLVRAGQTEGSVDLSRLAGLVPGAVICEVMDVDGTMMRLPGLLKFGRQHGMKVVTIADLIGYRMRKESFVKPVATVDLPTDYGTFRCVAFENELDTQVHVALVMGDPRPDEPTFVRVHRADLVSDVFGFGGESGLQRLDWCLQRIAQEGRGVILYLRTGANGEMAIDPLNRHLSRRTRPAPQESSVQQSLTSFREFGLGAQILSHLGLSKLRVLTTSTNVPINAVRGFGLEIVERVPISDEATTPPR